MSEAQLWWNTINTTGNMSGSIVIDKIELHNGTVSGFACSASYCSLDASGNIQFVGNITQSAGTYYFVFDLIVTTDICLSSYDNTGNYFLAEMNYPAAGKIGTSPNEGVSAAYSKANFTANTGVKMIALLHSGTSMWYYMNGTNVTENALMGGPTISLTGIGRPDQTVSPNGSLYIFAVWNRTLSEGEISYLHSLGKYFVPYRISDSCTAPTSGEWNITDNCNFTTSQNVVGNVTIFPGYNVTLNARFNFTNTSQYINIQNGSELRILSGGGLNG